MLHLDIKFTLADNDLRKVSRMCEAAGVEVRYPLLDEALVNFSGQLPIPLQGQGPETALVFQRSIKGSSTTGNHHQIKHGFGLPFGVWALSHAPLSELVDDSLNKFEDRGFLKT